HREGENDIAHVRWWLSLSVRKRDTESALADPIRIDSQLDPQVAGATRGVDGPGQTLRARWGEAGKQRGRAQHTASEHHFAQYKHPEGPRRAQTTRRLPRAT